MKEKLRSTVIIVSLTVIAGIAAHSTFAQSKPEAGISDSLNCDKGVVLTINYTDQNRKYLSSIAVISGKGGKGSSTTFPLQSMTEEDATFASPDGATYRMMTHALPDAATLIDANENELDCKK